jgi:hypothetical protein
MKKVYLHGENTRDIKEVELEATADHGQLVEIFKREFKITEPDGDYIVFLQEDVVFEDGEEIEVKAEIIHRGHYHFHRCKKIHTSVTYNGQTESFDFKPSATGNKVLKTVLKSFKISGNDAAGLILKVNDSLILKATDHIGSFAGHHDCKLSLILAPDKVIQG